MRVIRLTGASEISLFLVTGGREEEGDMAPGFFIAHRRPVSFMSTLLNL